MNVIDQFFTTPTGNAALVLFAASFLVFLLGVSAALRDGTFDLKYVDAFVRTTIWGRVAPVTGALLLGYVTHVDIITAGGVAAAAAVAAGMIGSALDSLRQLTMTTEKSAAVNAPPVA